MSDSPDGFERQDIRPALITSFEAFTQIQKLGWPVGVAAEVYCILDEDTEYFFSKRDSHIALHLANIVDNQTGLEAFAKKLSGISKPSGKPNIAAIATFLPELSSTNNLEAINALAAILKVALILRGETCRQPIRIVEAVSGSKTLGLWRGILSETVPSDKRFPLNEIEHFAQFLDDEDAIKILVDALDKVVTLVGREKLRGKLAIALELEPGPFYVLNRLSALENCLELLKDADLLPFVGFNLDIAHWHLAGIQLDELESKEKEDKYRLLKHQIVHAHISDHAKGHFGDLPIASHGFGEGATLPERRVVFERWIHFLFTCWSGERDKMNPPISKFISAEIEACRDYTAVEETVWMLRALLDHHIRAHA